MKIALVKITPENKKDLIEIAIAGYIGEKCKYCGHIFSSIQDIYDHEVVFAGKAQFACKECFQLNNPAHI